MGDFGETIANAAKIYCVILHAKVVTLSIHSPNHRDCSVPSK